MKKILISSIIVIGLISCEKNDILQPNSELICSWGWTSTDGGFASHIHENPSSTGNSYILKISNNNKIVIYKNGNEVFLGELEDYIQITEEYQV